MNASIYEVILEFQRKFSEKRIVVMHVDSDLGTKVLRMTVFTGYGQYRIEAEFVSPAGIWNASARPIDADFATSYASDNLLSVCIEQLIKYLQG